ncbi:tetratricopeptide repeat protein [Pseudobacteriovorax antillogorgiicola]|uniref:Tetratricopeptide repeat-containing protein n=1 Tax=Pseudobacteriovorax antillogorgiicola TaxID=1513793 RepID=A0A1Y6B719_9BACT|nr:tetratricopeptide repeat protein [Pseudobacteriovorax antillogorgiicola]TCS59514.1 tetratricopeptide repeat protein [Pseudobacteriovorax antillogorgiicola]SME87876.1 Tetratricopeptide repeat-containing protein [Pseudobacteriovorax antillogorgiicola]
MTRPQKRPKKLLVSSKAAKPLAQDPTFCILSIFLFLLIAFAWTAQASPVDTSIERLRSLEKDIWTSHDRDIHDLQFQVTQLIQLQPDSAFAHYLLGQLYIRQFVKSPYEMHLLRQAAELGQQAIDLKPDRDFGYVVASQVLDMMGYTSNASKLINPERNTKISNTWRTLFLQAKFNAAQNSYKKSLAILKESLSREDTQSEIIIPHALAIIESNLEGRELLKELRVWNNDFSNETVSLNLAIALSQQKKYEEAHKIYGKMIKTNPKALEARINDGIILYQHLDRRQDGKERLASILDHFSDRLTLEQKGIVKSHLARIFLRNRDFSEAESLFLSIIRESQEPLEWIALSHATYKEKKLYKEFSKLMRKVKEELPGSGPIYALHGEVLSEHLKKHSDAIDSYEGAILLEPSRSEFYNGLGLAYYRQKNMVKALNLFVQATQVDPNDATARYNEACVLAILGRPQEALGSLKEAITLDPRLQNTAQQDSDFKSIRDSDQFRALIGSGHNISEVTRPQQTAQQP